MIYRTIETNSTEPLELFNLISSRLNFFKLIDEMLNSQYDSRTVRKFNFIDNKKLAFCRLTIDDSVIEFVYEPDTNYSFFNKRERLTAKTVQKLIKIFESNNFDPDHCLNVIDRSIFELVSKYQEKKE